MSHRKYTIWWKPRYSTGTGACDESGFADWRKSSFSDGTGNCVEVATADGAIAVRDSKRDGRGPVLEFTYSKWAAFLRATKDGEFDLKERT